MNFLVKLNGSDPAGVELVPEFVALIKVLVSNCRRRFLENLLSQTAHVVLLLEGALGPFGTLLVAVVLVQQPGLFVGAVPRFHEIENGLVIGLGILFFFGSLDDCALSPDIHHSDWFNPEILLRIGLVCGLIAGVGICEVPVGCSWVNLPSADNLSRIPKSLPDQALRLHLLHVASVARWDAFFSILKRESSRII